MKADRVTILNQIHKTISDNVTLDQEQSKRFFKTAPGSYAAHDLFLGVTVPNLRKMAKLFPQIELDVIHILLSSKFNEERLLALLILVEQYKNADSLLLKEKIYKFYIDNLDNINNWNLVDASAHLIVGAHIYNNQHISVDQIFHLAKSSDIWRRRVAVISTLYFIRAGDLDLLFKIAEILLEDKHDLIHKAVGWMLREAGKKNELRLIEFLRANASNMPRTMLRYAIERLSKKQRQDFLSITKSNNDLC